MIEVTLTVLFIYNVKMQLKKTALGMSTFLSRGNRYISFFDFNGVYKSNLPIELKSEVGLSRSDTTDIGYLNTHYYRKTLMFTTY